MNGIVFLFILIYSSSYLRSDMYYVKKHAVHRQKKVGNKSETSPNHELALDTKVDVWFEDQQRYYTGKILSFEEKPDTYTILFHSKTNNDVTLSPENCTSEQIFKSDEGDRWNLSK